MNKREFYAQGNVSRGYDRLRFGGPGGQWVNRRELDITASLVPEGGRVVDLGCGTGRAALRLCGGRSVVGVDSSAEMLRAAREKDADANVAWVQGDLFAGPFAPGSFDAAVALRVAFHYRDLGALLAGAALMVRRGGAIVLDTYNWSVRALGALGRGTWGPRVFVHRPAAVVRAARAAGLSVQSHRAGFLFSPYLYSRFPPSGLNVLESLEARLPEAVLSRVFWRLVVDG